jgi:hypothetical protein
MSKLLVAECLAGFLGFAYADTLTLRDGRVLNGSYLGGDSRTIRFAASDRVETYSVEQISTITFGGDNGGSDPAPALRRREPEPKEEVRRDEAKRDETRRDETRRDDSKRDDARRDDARREDPPAQRESGPELRSGTTLTVRMIDSVDSQRDQIGKTYRASLDEPVVDSNGNTIIGRGADVVIKLVDDEQSGKLTGKTVLTLSLASIFVNGRMVDVNTMNVSEQSSSRTGRSGKVIGGAAAAGAIIGAIAGGGKGAAIGAGAGAGAGTVAEVATKGQKVHIPSETRLTFTLQDPVRF